MPEQHVMCGGLRAGRNKPEVLHIDVNAPLGSPNRVNLRIDQISRRLAQRFALIGTAGEIAVGAGVLPWKPGIAIQAAARCFRDWLEARGGIEPAEIKDGIDQVRAFVAAHGISRFVPAWEERGTEQITRDVAGYRKREEEGWDYYVTASAWKDEVCKGFNGATIAAALVARQLMVVPETGRHRACLVRVPEHGRQRLYHLSSKLLEGES